MIDCLRAPLLRAVCIAGFLALTTTLCFAQASPAPTGNTDKDQAGVMIDGVAAGGPAAKAGVSVHDIIVAVDGTPVHSLQPILQALEKHKPGDPMQLTIARWPKGTLTSVTMTLGANPIEPSQAYMGLSVTVGYMLLVPGGKIPPTQGQHLPET